MVAPLATLCVTDGDRNKDQRVSRDEMSALADTWFDRIDPSKTGRVSQSEFPQRFAAMFPPPLLGPTGFPIQAPATERGPDRQMGTWPEFNRMIGGFFKFHWNDGQLIHVKVDEPDHPLNAPFKGRPQLQIVDETYTFGRDTYSRQNVRVLTSVDYAKMSAEDKAKEQYPRPDGDYALSWIRREGKGRVFYEAHGHNEKIYALTTDPRARPPRHAARARRPGSRRPSRRETGQPRRQHEARCRFLRCRGYSRGEIERQVGATKKGLPPFPAMVLSIGS